MGEEKVAQVLHLLKEGGSLDLLVTDACVSLYDLVRRAADKMAEAVLACLPPRRSPGNLQGANIVALPVLPFFFPFRYPLDKTHGQPSYHKAKEKKEETADNGTEKTTTIRT
ncbi:hypothetical protein NDU88_006918 [Pleurodeles waltl]|uniref:Ribosomal RNA methyltransferase FtsJ domain-containing protein n=1 Tax=Pleurodeles waltl TaxID=8319 RepID=A0AAV7PSN1_PLEWA|nr:hypothetical protein NDU88_006918 [Pleurodeles waltl]